MSYSFKYSPKYPTPLIFLLLLMIIQGCDAQGDREIYSSYDKSIVPFLFDKPSKSIQLPDKLEEISGLSYEGPGLLSAIEDEQGIIYIISSETGEIKQQIKFEKKGDFEGIEKIGDTYYVIKSNGELYSVTRNGETVSQQKKEQTAFSGKNNLEGLGALNGNLLVACKGSGNIESHKEDGKAVYQMNASTYDLLLNQNLSVSEQQLQSKIDERLKDVKIHDFDPSGVATDPVSGLVYVLSADWIIAVLSADGALEEVVLLDRKKYRQPEGICFDPEGNLYISSEADGKNPMLFVFERK